MKNVQRKISQNIPLQTQLAIKAVTCAAASLGSVDSSDDPQC